MRDEIAFHLDMRSQELERRGVPPAAARAQAEREFGDVARSATLLHAQDTRLDRRRRWWRWRDELGRDLRFGVRLLVRQPAFAVGAMLVLGLGIGMSAAIVTIAHSILVRPLPVVDEANLVMLYGELDGAPKYAIPVADLAAFRPRARTLSAAAGAVYWGSTPRTMVDGDRVITLRSMLVTGDFFDVLGVRPALGRLLRPEEDVVGAVPVAVLSHRAWRRQFGADAGVVGRAITDHESGVRHTIVGVAPAGLEVPHGTDFWTAVMPATTSPSNPVSYAWVEVVGRLAAGATLNAASEELHAFRMSDGYSGPRLPQVRPAGTHLTAAVVGNVRPALLALAAAAGLLLLLTCVNIANLLVLRAAVRSRELSVRRALGAGPLQIVRQLMMESSVLAALGGALGVLFALGLLRAFVALAPAGTPRIDGLDSPVGGLAWALGVTTLATLLFGLAPALGSARPPASSLRGARAGSSRRAALLREGVVAVQIALAVVIVTAAGLLLSTMHRLQSVAMGFRTGELAVVQLTWPHSRYSQEAVHELVLPRIAAIDGVAGVVTQLLPPFAGGSGRDALIRLPEQSQQEATGNPLLNIEIAGASYFDVLGIRLLAGRAFSSDDVQSGAPAVAVVSESAARLFWPAGDAVGSRFHGPARGGYTLYEVVGVVADTRYRDLRTPGATLYIPPSRSAAGIGTTLILRTARPPDAVIADVTSVIAAVDPGIRTTIAASMRDVMAPELAQPRLNAMVLAVFALLAVVLATVGTYAVYAYAVRQRARELSVRLALGGTPARIRRDVLGRGLLVATMGALAGAAAALAAGGTLRALLFEVSPADARVIGGTAVGLLVTSLLACWVPARQASRVDAAGVLRGDAP